MKTTEDELTLHPEMCKLTDVGLVELALNEIGMKELQRATLKDCLLANAIARLMRACGGPFVTDDDILYLTHEQESGN